MILQSLSRAIREQNYYALAACFACWRKPGIVPVHAARKRETDALALLDLLNAMLEGYGAGGSSQPMNSGPASPRAGTLMELSG